jgi:hypothetical protein
MIEDIKEYVLITNVKVENLQTQLISVSRNFDMIIKLIGIAVIIKEYLMTMAFKSKDIYQRKSENMY